MNKAAGFTMIELMITVAILGIVMGLAAPSFTRMIEDHRVATQTNKLLAALARTRSEAIRLGAPVSMHVSDKGWSVLIGTAAETGKPNYKGEPILRHVAVQRVKIESDQPAISFDRLGRVSSLKPGEQLELTVSPFPCTTPTDVVRTVSLILTGRANITRRSCS